MQKKQLFVRKNPLLPSKDEVDLKSKKWVCSRIQEKTANATQTLKITRKSFKLALKGLPEPLNFAISYRNT